MGKYIKTRDQLNEAIGNGSVILLAGKKDKAGKSKLYATHIIGHNEFRPGVIMLFLAKVFYRIVNRNGKAEAVSVDYVNEKSLKDILNIQGQATFSVVKNNNKTPYHWITLKQDNIQKTLPLIDGLLTNPKFDLTYLTVETDLNEIYNIVLRKTLNTVITGKQLVSILSYRIEDKNDDLYADQSSESMKLGWEMEFEVYDSSLEISDALRKADETQPIILYILFATDFALKQHYDPGDYHNPPDSHTEVVSSDTVVDLLMFNETEFSMDDKTDKLLTELGIYNFDWNDIKLKAKNHIRIPNFRKYE